MICLSLLWRYTNDVISARQGLSRSAQLQCCNVQCVHIKQHLRRRWAWYKPAFIITGLCTRTVNELNILLLFTITLNLIAICSYPTSYCSVLSFSTLSLGTGTQHTIVVYCHSTYYHCVLSLSIMLLYSVIFYCVTPHELLIITVNQLISIFECYPSMASVLSLKMESQ